MQALLQFAFDLHRLLDQLALVNEKESTEFAFTQQSIDDVRRSTTGDDRSLQEVQSWVMIKESRGVMHKVAMHKA